MSFELGYHLKAWLGVCAFKMAHSPGCWQEAFVPYHVGISTGCLSVFNAESGFPQSKGSKGERASRKRGHLSGPSIQSGRPSLLLYSIPYNWVLSPAHTQGEGSLFPAIEEKSKKSVNFEKSIQSACHFKLFLFFSCAKYIHSHLRPPRYHSIRASVSIPEFYLNKGLISASGTIP